MKYIISFFAAIVGLFLGNFFSLLFYYPCLLVMSKVTPEAKGQKWGILSLYISRACMGIGVSLIFWVFEYLGAIRSVLTYTFGIWALFLSEPFSEIQAHDICQGNLDKYQSLRSGGNSRLQESYFILAQILLFWVLFILLLSKIKNDGGPIFIKY